MDSISSECFICSYRYNDIDNFPLVLDCGHTFCKSCLQKLEEQGNRQCPICKAPVKPVREMPKCYQLVPIDILTCKQHGQKARMWCSTCEELACENCIAKDAIKCKMKLLSEAVSEIRQSLKQEIALKRKELKISLSKINDLLQKETRRFKVFEDFGHQQLSMERNTTEERIEELERSLKSVSSSLATIDALDPNEVKGTIPNTINFLLRSREQVNAEDCNSLPLNLTSCPLMNLIQTQETSKPGSKVLEQSAVFGASLSALIVEKGHWLIANAAAAATATFLLMISNAEAPKKVTVSVPARGGDLETRHLEHLFPLVARSDSEVSLKFKDSFYFPNDDSSARDRKRLGNFMIEERRAKLIEFVGHLDVSAAKQLPQHELLELGLVLAGEQDCEALTICAAWFDGILNLSVPRSVEDNVLENVQKVWSDDVALHFPNIGIYDFEWMKQTIVAMVPEGCVYSLHLPQSRYKKRDGEILLDNLASFGTPASSRSAFSAGILQDKNAQEDRPATARNISSTVEHHLCSELKKQFRSNSVPKINLKNWLKPDKEHCLQLTCVDLEFAEPIGEYEETLRQKFRAKSIKLSIIRSDEHGI